MLSTPAGSPASARIPPSASAESGVRHEGRRITVQPAASAAPTPRAGTASGKFQGVTIRHGPTGRLRTITRVEPSGASEQVPETRTASSAHHSRYSAAKETSSRASARGLPISSVRTSESHSDWRSSSSAARRRIRARSRAGDAAQEACAPTAASRASRASASPASATAQIGSPVEGSSTVRRRPLRAGRQRPSMKSSFGQLGIAPHSASSWSTWSASADGSGGAVAGSGLGRRTRGVTGPSPPPAARAEGSARR